MDDLISRQEAIYAVLRAEALVRAYGYRYAADAVRELPSAQPQPVVICKDCKYADDDGVCQNSVGLVIQDDDDFCSKAERRTDETD